MTAPTNPLDFFQYSNGRLSCEGVSLDKIADATGTPVYIYSTKAFLAPLDELKKGLSNLDHLICFAVKSNSNIAILKTLVNAGSGLDLVSGGELFRAGIAGASAKKVVFSGVGKTPGEMAQALHYDGEGILSFNVESVDELVMLNAVAGDSETKAPVALRFNPDVDAKTHPYISTGLKKNKFGMQRSEILEVARNVSQFKNIDLNGISIHIGSQLTSIKPLGDAFSKTRKMIEEINSVLPRPLSIVDLGGGLGVNYHQEAIPSIKTYCQLILKHFGPKSRLKSPLKVLIEPGRLISANSGVLVTEVLYRKKRAKKDFVVVDAAMNDLIRPALYQSYHQIVPLRKNKGPNQKVDVVGPVCETADCFAHDRALPASLRQGDLIALLSAGAYGFTMSSNYNSRPRPPEVLVESGNFRIIRDRETYDDLVRGESL